MTVLLVIYFSGVILSWCAAGIFWYDSWNDDVAAIAGMILLLSLIWPVTLVVFVIMVIRVVRRELK